MKRFFAKIGRFFWSWGFLAFVLSVIVVVVLLYIEEDWRGARAWAATKAKWEASGESLDPEKFIPPPVADEQNLGGLPVFRLEPDPQNGGELLPLPLREAVSEEKHGGELPKMKDRDKLRDGVRTAYIKVFPSETPPANSLAQLEALYPIINDVRQAAQRPFCRFNEDYGPTNQWNRGFSLLTSQIALCKLFALHAMIALQENQPSVALDDIKVNFKLAKGVGRDPSLVAGLVAIGIVAITRTAAEDGLIHHAWNDGQLIDLQNELGRMDFLNQFRFTMRGEIATETVPLFNKVKASRGSLLNDLLVLSPESPDGSIAALFRDTWAAGWWDIGLSRMVDFMFREVQTIDPKSRVVDVSAIQKLTDETIMIKKMPRAILPRNLLYAISADPFANGAQNFARIQAQLDEDRIVCALDRYRLEQGKYPETINVLAPTFIDKLPHDIINGDAYHYQLALDGTYRLYSVGWNQADDGGQIMFKKDSPLQIDYNKGDWVWPMVPVVSK